LNGFFKNIIWISAFVLVGLTLFLGLFIDLTGDAALYAAISRQMVESGDWFNLKINGIPYDQKPHLLFWLSGVGITLFGNTNFAFKLFPVLAALSGIYFVYRLARLFYSEKSGRLAALITGTSQMFFLYLFDIHTDTVLQSGVTLACWQLAEYLKNRRSGNFIIGFLGIGLAMLTKGPIGAVIPFFFVFFWLLAAKDFKQLFHPKWLLGIFIVLGVVSPTLLHLWNSFGWEGIRFYFVDNNLGRVTGDVAGSNTDPFFYVYNLLWALSPWTILILAALFFKIKSRMYLKLSDKPGFSLLSSVLVLFIVYSISRGKAPNYLMLTIPLLVAVAAGTLANVFSEPFPFKRLHFYVLQKGEQKMDPPVLQKSFQQQIKGMVLLHAFVLFVLFVLFLLSCLLLPEKKLFLLLILVAVTFFLLIIFFIVEPGSWARLIYTSVIFAGIFNLYLHLAVVPGLFRYQGAHQALEIYESTRSSGGLLKSLHLEEYALFYWPEAPVEDFSTWENFYAFLEQEEPWVYTNQIGYNVVRELTSQIDTVYVIPQRGMNEITLSFLLPSSRQSALKENYLIKIR